jgi:hypothetical protein
MIRRSDHSRGFGRRPRPPATTPPASTSAVEDFAGSIMCIGRSPSASAYLPVLALGAAMPSGGTEVGFLRPGDEDSSATTAPTSSCATRLGVLRDSAIPAQLIRQHEDIASSRNGKGGMQERQRRGAGNERCDRGHAPRGPADWQHRQRRRLADKYGC